MNSTNKVIRLGSYETTEELLKEKFEEFNGNTCNGMAIVFSSERHENGLLMFDLMRTATQNLMDSVKRMETVESFRPDGQIDPELKLFLDKYLQMTQWILNSSSVSRSNLKELASFDKFEISDKLRHLADLIDRQ